MGDVVEERCWLIRKGGLYYRPNRSGYTANVHDAGRYTKAEAEREAAIEPWHMAAIHERDAAKTGDPRTEADTAYLEGVKAGLEAAAQWADRGKATYVKWVGQCAGHDERYMAADAIRGIDPATITRKGGADE